MAVARGMELYPLGSHSRAMHEVVEEDLIDDRIMLAKVVFVLLSVMPDLFLCLAAAGL
jgi:hypothetical protein